jgi:hypothetical protein
LSLSLAESRVATNDLATSPGREPLQESNTDGEVNRLRSSRRPDSPLLGDPVHPAVQRQSVDAYFTAQRSALNTEYDALEPEIKKYLYAYNKRIRNLERNAVDEDDFDQVDAKKRQVIRRFGEIKEFQIAFLGNIWPPLVLFFVNLAVSITVGVLLNLNTITTVTVSGILFPALYLQAIASWTLEFMKQLRLRIEKKEPVVQVDIDIPEYPVSRSRPQSLEPSQERSRAAGAEERVAPKRTSDSINAPEHVVDNSQTSSSGGAFELQSLPPAVPQGTAGPSHPDHV